MAITTRTIAQVEGVWTAFGGNPAYYNGWSKQNNGLFDVIAPLFGDLYCQKKGCEAGEGWSYWLTSDEKIKESNNKKGSEDQKISKTRIAARTYDRVQNSASILRDFISLQAGERIDKYQYEFTGSALIRPTAVPVPAAVWLFSVGLLGLFGVARRKVHV